MDKAKVRERFSRSAHNYENFDLPQSRLAEKLFSELRQEFKGKTACLLDIGTGTGRLLSWIRERLPEMDIIGLDFSEGMLRRAAAKDILSGVSLLQADAECLPFKEDTFDFVISNSVYQWVNDLYCALSEVRRILKKGGWFFFSVFGRDTLQELEFCIRTIKSHLRLHPLPDKDEIREVLERIDFKDIGLVSEVYCHSYKNIRDALMWLKHTGTSYRADRIFSGLGGRRLIRQIQQIYDSHFKNKGDFAVTYQMILVKARKI